MNRPLAMSSCLAAASGAAWLVPAITAGMERSGLRLQECLIASLGPVLILCGMIGISRNIRELRQLSFVPAAVRVGIAGTGLFVVFCVLEFSDGLLRQNGRIFYWTSLVFLPALALFYGQLLAYRWAWWGTRIVAAIFALWFAGILMVIPFAHLRGNGGPAPWWGKVYAECVTLVFVSASAGIFLSLGGAEARKFYGIGHKAPATSDAVGGIGSAESNLGGL